MEIDELMENYGFSVSSSCGGFEWYNKIIKHKGRDAFITLTNKDGSGLPNSMDDPILVDIYDSQSGNELEKSQSYASLKSFLDTIDR